MRTGKPDPGMMANGMLAGLVAITAPCAFVQPWAAAVIGCIAGVLVIESIFFVEKKFKIDDPVGAISVHGVNGLFGVLCRRALRQRHLRRAAGTSPSRSATDGHGRDRDLRLRRQLRRQPRRSGSCSRRPSAAWCSSSSCGRHRLRLLQDPEPLTKGGIRSDRGGRAGGPRPARDGRPGLPRVRRSASAAMARATVARWSRRRSTPDMSHGGGRSRVLRPPRPRLRCGRCPVAPTSMTEIVHAGCEHPGYLHADAPASTVAPPPHPGGHRLERRPRGPRLTRSRRPRQLRDRRRGGSRPVQGPSACSGRA